MAMTIARFTAKVPRIDAPSQIKIETAWQSGSQLKIGFAATSQPVTEIFVEGPAGIAFKQPVFANNIAVIDLESGLKTPLAGQTVDLTVIAGDDFTTQSIMVEKDAPLAGSFAAGKPEPIDASAMVQFWTVIGFAFLGGLILNLMPCVLPVLAIKLAAIIEASGQSRGFVRLRFGAGAMGILSSFAILAAGLATLRLAGGQIGWGIQFQSPVFLAMMMLVLGLFTLNMLDRFFLPIPAFLQASFRGNGQNVSGKKMPIGKTLMAKIPVARRVRQFCLVILWLVCWQPCWQLPVLRHLSAVRSLWRLPAIWRSCLSCSWRWGLVLLRRGGWLSCFRRWLGFCRGPVIGWSG
jgi:suppressor for copper-sensitivity B